MKSKILNFLLCVCLGATTVFQSCEKDDEPEPLVANAGEDFTAAPLTTVQLDGSASTPTGQMQFEWEYSGPVAESEINFQDMLTATPTFVPPQNGTYYFTLNVTRNNEFMTDQVIVTVEGFVTLATSSQNIVLKNIEADPTKPDYKLNDLLVLSANSTLNVPQGTNGSIVIECSESAGITMAGSNTLSQVEFTSPSGWKGIKLESGTLTMAGVTMRKAGKKSFFDGAAETAAVTVTGGTLDLTNSQFTGTTGYDLLITNNSLHTITGNTFGSVKPIKGPIASVSSFTYNNFPSADYITLTTPGAGTFVTSNVNAEFRFGNGKKYYIDGDFTANSLITIESNATIFVKENAGIVAGQGSNIQGGSSSKATIDGLNSAVWKGILLSGSTSHTVNGLIIKNAGSQVFNTGALTTDVKAAIYVNNNATASFQNIEVHASQGYGVSWSSQNPPPGMINNTFINGLSAPIRVPYYFAHLLLRENHNNAFTLGANIPAVELYGNSSMQSGTVWRPLHGNNFYLATTNIVLTANLALMPGVKVRFASNRYMTGAGTLTAVGSTEAPIILEGPADSPGSWPGILLEGLFTIEHCQIKNAGQSMMSGATAPAALVIKYNGATHPTTYSFKNNTVTGSTGLGVLIEVGGKDPGIDDPANNNSYSNNTAGNTLKK